MMLSSEHGGSQDPSCPLDCDVEKPIIDLDKQMRDGDAHPLAIAEIQRIVGRGGDFARAVGALIRKRRDTILAGVLDGAFESHEVAPEVCAYSVNHCMGWVGTSAVFTVEDDTLKLLSVVAFDNFMHEAMSGQALHQALQLASARI